MSKYDETFKNWDLRSDLRSAYRQYTNHTRWRLTIDIEGIFDELAQEIVLLSSRALQSERQKDTVIMHDALEAFLKQQEPVNEISIRQLAAELGVSRGRTVPKWIKEEIAFDVPIEMTRGNTPKIKLSEPQILRIKNALLTENASYTKRNKLSDTSKKNIDKVIAILYRFEILLLYNNLFGWEHVDNNHWDTLFKPAWNQKKVLDSLMYHVAPGEDALISKIDKHRKSYWKEQIKQYKIKLPIKRVIWRQKEVLGLCMYHAAPGEDALISEIDKHRKSYWNEQIKQYKIKLPKKRVMKQKKLTKRVIWRQKEVLGLFMYHAAPGEDVIQKIYKHRESHWQEQIERYEEESIELPAMVPKEFMQNLILFFDKDLSFYVANKDPKASYALLIAHKEQIFDVSALVFVEHISSDIRNSENNIEVIKEVIKEVLELISQMFDAFKPLLKQTKKPQGIFKKLVGVCDKYMYLITNAVKRLEKITAIVQDEISESISIAQDEISESISIVLHSVLHDYFNLTDMMEQLLAVYISPLDQFSITHITKKYPALSPKGSKEIPNLNFLDRYTVEELEVLRHILIITAYQRSNPKSKKLLDQPDSKMQLLSSANLSSLLDRKSSTVHERTPKETKLIRKKCYKSIKKGVDEKTEANIVDKDSTDKNNNNSIQNISRQEQENSDEDYGIKPIDINGTDYRYLINYHNHQKGWPISLTIFGPQFHAEYRLKQDPDIETHKIKLSNGVNPLKGCPCPNWKKPEEEIDEIIKWSINKLNKDANTAEK